MKHVIEVPAGHTVQISRHGNRVTVESAESTNQLSPVGGIKLAGDPAATEEVTNAGVDAPKVYEPGTVLLWAYRKPFTETVKPREFIVYGSDNRPTCTLDSEKVLKVNPEGYHSDWYAIRTARIATPAEREEFLNDLRDWYSLTITETGELVNWRAKRSGQYYYIDTEGRVSAIPEYFDNCDNLGYRLGNYFPEGFLTDERLSEYRATVQKLFNKWRGLCQE